MTSIMCKIMVVVNMSKNNTPIRVENEGLLNVNKTYNTNYEET